MNCTIARKINSHWPTQNAMMKRSMNKPRIHTSRVVGFTAKLLLGLGGDSRPVASQEGGRRRGVFFLHLRSGMGVV